MADASASRKLAKMLEVDRFDALPNDLLTDIISFLPFKDAVRASCLGRRWRHRWLELRKINLDETEFTSRHTRSLLDAAGRQSLADGVRLTGRRHFVDFVNRFVARYAEPKVKSVRLAVSNPAEYGEEVKAWVRAMAARNVENLDLNFSDPETLSNDFEDNYGCFDLPEEVYGLRLSLRMLELSACDIRPDRMGDLHALRVLSLSRIAMARDSVEILTSSCPLLEELYLDHLADTDEVVITSASRRLRVVDINDCDPMVYGVRIIQVPALRFFRYLGFTGVFEVRQLKSLEEVELFFPGDDALDACELLRDLLVSLKMVKKLTVCTNMLQVTPFGEDPWRLSSTLDKLRDLTLHRVTLHKDEIQGIGLLLRSCPYLESLTIVLDTRDVRPSLWRVLVAQEPVLPCGHSLDSAGSWDEQLQVPMVGLMCALQSVTVEGFTGEASQSDCVRVILETAQALRELHIEVSQKPSSFGQTDVEFRFRQARKLLEIDQRASEEVEITIE